jgi:hypothetical protein
MKGRQHTCIGAVLEVTNIGTGPALQVTWSIKRFSQTGGFIPYVAVGQSVSLRQASKVKMKVIATEFEVLFAYTSLSGTKYLSRTMVENSQEIANFEISVEK